MTAIRLARHAGADIGRLVEFPQEEDPQAAGQTFDLIAGAIEVLASHPLIGRPVESGFRELVISRGRSGYLALYDYDPVRDEIVVTRIRHQREAGYQ